MTRCIGIYEHSRTLLNQRGRDSTKHRVTYASFTSLSLSPSIEKPCTLSWLTQTYTYILGHVNRQLVALPQIYEKLSHAPRNSTEPFERCCNSTSASWEICGDLHVTPIWLPSALVKPAFVLPLMMSLADLMMVVVYACRT